LKIDCPNVSLPAWKDLVDKVGAEKAYTSYFRNGHEIPDHETATGHLSRRPTDYKGPADEVSRTRQYAQIPQSKGGRYISTDVARKIIPGYNPLDPTATNHEASQVTDRAFKQGLKDPKVKDVEILAGGSGAGKSSALRMIHSPDTLIYDGLFASPSSLKRLDETISSGKPVTLTYIYRGLEPSITGMIKRRGGDVPVVPHDVLANGHFNSADNFLIAAEKYKDNPQVSFKVIDNGDGAGNARVVEDPIGFMKKVVETRPGKDEYLERARNHPDVAKLSDAERRTYLGDKAGQDAGNGGQPERGGIGGPEEAAVAPAPGGVDVQPTPATTGASSVEPTQPGDKNEQAAPVSETPPASAGRSQVDVRSGRGPGAVDSPASPDVPGSPYRPPGGVLREGPGGQRESLGPAERSELRSGTVTSEPSHAPQSAVEGIRTQEVPLSQLSLSEDVPQFKAGANEEGVVEPLQGKYDRRGVGPIAIWERANGKREVISGRHRFKLARDTGETTIPGQIFKETEGFDKQAAARLDAELNIRDGNGTIGDYSNYFRHSGVTESDAVARGLLARTKGKTGFQVARDASEDLFALHQGGRVSDDAASSISRAAPGDGGLQSVGVRAVLDGKSAAFAENLVQAAKLRSGGSSGAETGDLFAFDDTAMREMEAQAKRAQDAQRAIREQISAAQGAARNPVMAKRLGVDVRDPASVQAKITQLKGELERWQHWPTQSDLVAKTLDPTFDARAQVQAMTSADRLKEALQLKGQSPAELEADKAAAAERAAKAKTAAAITTKAEAPLTGDSSNVGQGQLLASDEDLFSGESAETQGKKSGVVSGSFAENWADQVLADKKGQVSAGLDPELISALAIKGAAILERGIREKGAWVAEMIKQFGEDVRDHLDAIWNEMRANGAEIGDKPRPTKEEGKNFRSLPDTEREGQRAAGTEPAVERQTYDVRSRNQARAAARVMIDMGGADKAREMARDPESQLPQDVRGGIYVELAADADRRIRDAKTPEEKAAAIRDRQALSSSEAPELTGLGQRISMMAELNKHTRAGVTEQYLGQTERRQRQDFGPDGQKAAQDFADANNKVNADAVPGAVDQLRPSIAKIKLSEPIWQKYQQDAATRLADLVDSKAEPPKEKAPLQEFTKRIVDEIRGRIGELLPEREKGTPATPIEILSEAMKNPEKFKQLVDTVRKEFVDRYGEGSPPVELIDTELANMDLKPYSNRILDRAIADAHEAMQAKVADLAKQHFTRTDRVHRDLADSLVDTMKLKPADAKRLADDLFSRMQELTGDARKKAVDQLVQRAQTPRARNVISQLQKAVDLNNLGAMTEATARDAVAKRLGLTHSDPETLARLGHLADKVETAPNVAAKAKATVDLAAAMRDAQRIGRWSDIIDVATSTWYANLLAGSAVVTKTTADVYNTFSQMGTAMLNEAIHGNPANAVHLVGDWVSGLSEGAERLRAAVKTGKGGVGYDATKGGYADSAGDARPLSQLEGTWIPQRYVPRAFKGIEALFHVPAREAYTKLQATKLLQGEYKGAALRRKVRDVLGQSPDLFAKFRAQAESEGFKKEDLGLRIGHLLEEHRRSSEVGATAADAAKRFANSVVLKQDPEGWAGAIYRKVRDAVEDIRPAGIPALKPFFAFLRIPTNFINQSFNYTPLGISRGMFGMLDSKGEGKVPMSIDERNRLIIQGVAGTAMMAGVATYLVNRDPKENHYFDIEGQGPKDFNKRQQLQQAGWVPNSIKVGDTYIGYHNTPLMVPLAVLGAVSDNIKYGTQKDESILGSPLADAALRGTASVFSLSMLSGMSNLMDFLQNKATPDRINKFLASIATSFVLPAGGRQLDQVLDPTQYGNDGKGGLLGSQVPGLRRTGSPRIGPTGDPMTYSPMQRFVSEAVPGVAKTLSDKGVFISAEPRPKISGRVANSREYQRYQEMAGKEIADALRGAMSEIQGMDQKRAQARVNKIVSDARVNARIRLEQLGPAEALTP
jgi:polyhydroxyalkanoate synthesis regulator phasin